jgi:hypothetical protein
MKTVTIKQALTFGWCYPKRRIRAIAGGKTEWTALDVLRLTKVPAKDRMYAVLREEFIDRPIRDEFACRAAEWARSVAAIEVKRRWLRGEVTNEERAAAEAAAEAVAWAAAWAAAEAVAWHAAEAAAWKKLVEMLIQLLEEAA